MNDLQLFINQKFGTVRIIPVNDKPYFVANDVAKALGYKNPSDATNKHCKKPIMTWGSDSLGRQQEFKVISEGDVYRLITRSKLPTAEDFESWVFDEILPQIRMTGGYIPPAESNELILAKAIKIADETIKHKDEIIELQSRRISDLKPIEENYKILMDTKGSFSMNKVAHYVGMGEYNLFKFLREVNVLFLDDNKDNVPYENPVNKTKFIVVPAIAPDGSVHSVTRVLPKGIDYICNLLKKHNRLEVAQ